MLKSSKDPKRAAGSEKRRPSRAPKVYEADTVQDDQGFSGYANGPKDHKWHSGKQVGNKI